jgi:hypothetical protein
VAPSDVLSDPSAKEGSATHSRVYSELKDSNDEGPWTHAAGHESSYGGVAIGIPGKILTGLARTMRSSALMLSKGAASSHSQLERLIGGWQDDPGD